MKPTPDMSTTLKEDLERVLEKLDRIERLIKDKEQNEPFEYPKDSTPQPYYPTNPFPHTVNSTVCSKCGLEFKGATSFYCLHNDCPTFIKAT